MGHNPAHKELDMKPAAAAILAGLSMLVTFAGCAVTPESATESSSEDLSLQPVQIKTIHVARATETTVSYTGQPRYVGAQIHATKGTDISVTTRIDRGLVAPVAAVADVHLHVLARSVGQTITGSPNLTLAFADAIAPEDGTYWVLFGEDSRQSFELEVSYSLLGGASAACSADSDCISNACVHGACELSPSFGNCIDDGDCTSGKCGGNGKSSGQCSGLPEGTCKVDADCTQHVCKHDGTCGCMAVGTSPPGGTANTFFCCSQEVDDHGVCK
jgi:hypothetical protein